jgi:outer membrane protein assembly factor BamB
MSRRRDYLTFFANRRARGDFVLAHDGRSRLRWILPAVVVAAAGGLAFWWFTRPSPNEAPGPGGPAAGVSTVPTILHPISTSTTAAGGVEALCPPSVGEVHWTTFKGSPERSGCIDAPVITTPEILWAAKVGVQAWLNNPVVVDDTVFVGSAGNVQFESDAADGVYALDLAGGTRRWFLPASLDVNGVAADEDVVVATGDEGLVWGIDPVTGLALWTANLGAAVFTNPLLVDGKAVVGDQTGTVSAFDVRTGQRQWSATVAGAVRGGAAYDGERIFVVGEEREVLALDLQGRELWRVTITGRSGEGDELRVFAAPAVAGDALIVSLVREAVFGEPGLVALDRETGDVLWWAVDAAGIKSEWANVRSSPAVVGDLLVYGEPYSNRLVALGAVDGRTRWSTEVGAYCYPHWSSPAVVSGRVILARDDGGLYAVDVATQTQAWAIYLGLEVRDGAFPDDFDDEFCVRQPRTGTSVIASPAVADNGVVLVGSLEGYLFAIGDAAW